MYEKYLSTRISELRGKKEVSARDMSLTLGQNENYINHIENNKNMPSMQVFFYICEYFKLTPMEFFDEGKENPALLQSVMSDLSALDETRIKNIHEIIKDLKHLICKTNP